MVELFLFEVHGYMEEEYISEQIIVLFGKQKATKSIHYISKWVKLVVWQNKLQYINAVW